MAESEYYSTLPVESQRRYKEKISKINNIDPYALKKNDFLYEHDFYPKINFNDISSYLLFAPCPVSAKEMKSYKSLEAYNQFHWGWLKEIGIKLFHNDKICLVRGRVSTVKLNCLNKG